MQKIAPGEQVRQQLQAFLDDGSCEAPVSAFLRLAVQRIVQELLEQEVTNYLHGATTGSRGIATAMSQVGCVPPKGK